jgi:glycosyltransferase involved in cell wall biosynthesis
MAREARLILPVVARNPQVEAFHNMTMPIQLSIVVPCYNEEEVLPETDRRLIALLDRLVATGLVTGDSAVHYVDDGSRDRTWPLIQELAKQDSRVHGLKLSRNRGHQMALMAGLLTVPGDALVSIDADLQDDVNVIEAMVREHLGGAEVVFGVRDSRTTDTGFKRRTALMYYGLMRRMGVDLVHNHADFRLMGRRAVEALREYGEANMFLRGIVPMIGYRAATVKYDRAERFAGVSKYPLRKMMAFAIEGITSLSVVPLRLITLLGFVVSGFSFAMILFIIYGTLVLKAAIPGWASSVVPIYFLGGIQLLSIGILGEYVAKIYLETKQRPRYFIEEVI